MNTRELLETVVGKRKAGMVIRTRYLLAIDSLSVLIASGLSQAVLQESIISAFDLFQEYWLQLALFLVIRISLNGIFGLYSRLWRYASVLEMIQVFKSAFLSGVVLITLGLWALPELNVPTVHSFSFHLLDGLLYMALISGCRFGLRIAISWLAANNRQLLGNLAPQHRVLIVGAGENGSFMIRLMLDHPELGILPIGIIDDNPVKRSLRIHDIPVLGMRDRIPELVQKYHIHETIITISHAAQKEIDAIYSICAQADVPVRIAPEISSLVSGHIPFDHIRRWRPSTILQPASPVKISYTFSNILVTGSAGFIGSNFVRHMLTEHPDSRIIVYDKLTYAGNLDNLLGLSETYGDRFVFIHGDITNAEQVSDVIRSHQVDAIVNFAAETHVDRSLITPDEFLKTNILGTHCLLEAAKANKVVRYHQVSTDEVYGQVMQGSFYEEDPLETRSPYSASKASADLFVHAYFVSYGVQATITRGSNNIGPYQYPEKAVPLFITNALENKPLPIYGDGLYVRDYQYVLDHCKGIDLVLHRGTPGEVYNLGGGNEVEAIRLAKMILDRLGKPHSLIYMVQDRCGQDRRYSLNCSKVKALGWRPEWDFESALNATIDWYVENEWWWRKLKCGEYKQFYEVQYRDRLNHAVRPALAN